MAERRRRPGTVRALLSLGILLGVTHAGTLASWSRSTTLSPGGFGASNLDLRLRDATTTVGAGGTFANADLAPAGLVPGESIAASFPVRNDGGFPFTWVATATATGSLAPGLTVSSYVGGTATNATSVLDVRTGSCGGTVSTSAQTLNATAKTVIAAQPALAVGAAVNVCVLLSLPASATSYAAMSASLSYAFSATQRVNP